MNDFKIKPVLVLIILGFTILFTGCDLFMQPPIEDVVQAEATATPIPAVPGEPVEAPVQRGNISFNFGPTGAKTILPNVSSRIDHYIIQLSGPETVSDTNTTSATPTVSNLAVGSWSVTVLGKNSSGQTIAEGNGTSISVTSGGTTNKNITLNPSQNGSGSISITIKWDSSSVTVIDNTTATLQKVGSSAQNIVFDTNSSAQNATYSGTHTAGSYFLAIKLQSGTKLYATVMEAVQVFDNLDSNATITLVTADFTSAPPAPSSLSSSESNGSINLIWTDNANTETGFILERSTTSGSGFSTLYNLGHNVTGLTDSTASAGTTYYYRLKATNSFGNSSYTSETSKSWALPVPGNSSVMSSFTSVTTTGMTANWTSGTDDNTGSTSLQYLLYYSTSNNIGSVAAAEANGTAVGSYTSNISTKAITGLTQNTKYYVTVIVKDLANNKAAYTVSSQMTVDGEAPSPGNSGTLGSFTSVSASGMTANWTAATDNNTTTANLEYLVYYSTSNNISSVAAAEANGTAVGSYTANSTTKAITGLGDNTNYYVTVLAKDEAGNKAAYGVGQQMTTDGTAPVAGNSGTLTTSSVTTTGFTVNWTAATDNNNTAANLQYLVYHSTSNNISTVAAAEANGTVVGSYAANITSKAITGLSSSTNYYFNVLVKDTTGNKATYNDNNQTTTSNAAPVASSVSQSGNAPYGSSLTGSYSYSDADSDSEGTSTFKWYRYDDNGGTNETEISGATSSSYTTVAADVGKYIKFEVTPKASSGTTTGTAVKASGYFGPVTDGTAPSVGSFSAATSITSSGFTVNWSAATDTITAQSSLQYLVYYSTSDNIATVAAAEANGTAVGSYTANITTKAISSLGSSTNYYYNVLVKDAAGNKAAYTDSNQTTTSNAAPVASSVSQSGNAPYGSSLTGSYSYSDADSDSEGTSTFKWYRYDDNGGTNETEISGATSSSYTTVAADVGKYIKFEVTPKASSGNTTGTAVKASSYFGPVTDTTAPTAGNSGTFSAATDVNSSAFSPNWTAATDGVTAQASLQYLLYYSTSDNISTVAAMEANGTAVGTYASNIITKAITGLSASTTYYYNVIVKDAAGNKAAYTKNSQATSASGPPSTVAVANYTIDPADGDGSGTYTKLEDNYNSTGKPRYRYQLTASHYFFLYWSTGMSKWLICNGSYNMDADGDSKTVNDNDYAYYNTTDSGTTPPSSGWKDYNDASVSLTVN